MHYRSLKCSGGDGADEASPRVDKLELLVQVLAPSVLSCRSSDLDLKANKRSDL